MRDRYEAHHRVTITDPALVAAATLADRYVNDRFLPDKAIDLIDEAGARLRIRRMTAPPELRELDEEIAEAKRAKEVFVTAASSFVMPIVSLDGSKIADGKPGPIATRLRQVYLEQARRDAV